MRVKTAVFPAAGLGTRFLPATKSQPKEMLPLVDKPMIQYVIEEARNSGIEHVILITGRGKTAIEDHFDISFELEANLRQKGQEELLELTRSISNLMTVSYVRQQQPLGLGHAILCARHLIREPYFAVLLGDDIVDGKIPCLKQMIDVHEERGGSVLAAQQVSMESISSYGVISGQRLNEKITRVSDMIEKPPREEAPSNLAIIGRYILNADIFAILENTPKGKGGEIQLTDGLRDLVKKEPIYALEFEGTRYDTGNKQGFLQATVEFALKRPDLGPEFRKYLKGLEL